MLILDEPTRGVDVGAKAEIHAWIDELAGRGCAVLLISSELPELLNLSSRILVLASGSLVGEVPRGEANQDTLLRLMTGLTPTSGQLDAGVTERTLGAHSICSRARCTPAGIPDNESSRFSPR